MEIREQLEKFETSVAEIPPVVIEDVRRRQTDELRKKLSKTQAEWGKKAEELEQQRVRVVLVLVRSSQVDIRDE